MIITVIENSTSTREQKLNKTGFNSSIIDEVKKIIDKDPFGLFQIKSSVLLDHEIKEINLKIESLVKTNTELKTQLEKNQKELEDAQTKNNAIIEKMKSVIK